MQAGYAVRRSPSCTFAFATRPPQESSGPAFRVCDGYLRRSLGGDLRFRLHSRLDLPLTRRSETSFFLQRDLTQRRRQSPVVGPPTRRRGGTGGGRTEGAGAPARWDSEGVQRGSGHRRSATGSRQGERNEEEKTWTRPSATVTLLSRRRGGT